MHLLLANGIAKGVLLSPDRQRPWNAFGGFLSLTCLRRCSFSMASLSLPSSSSNTQDDSSPSHVVSTEDKASAAPVTLVWEMVDPKMIFSRSIRLQEAVRGMKKQPSVETFDEDVIAGVPASVLQFERAKRKAQQEFKVNQSFLDDLDVIYEDDDIVVVNKASGVLTVPGVHQRNANLAYLVHEKYGRYKDGTVIQKDQMIVHRLDMDTSGLVVFGRSRAVTAQLHKQFRERKVEKEYLAVVMGTWPVEHCWTGYIDLPLQKDVAHPPFMRVSTPAYLAYANSTLNALQRAGWKKLVQKPPMLSQTEFHVLSTGTTLLYKLPYTKLRLIPLTGRTHQLRVHCAALGFPIVGDIAYSLYGGAAPTGGLSSYDHLIRLVDTSNAGDDNKNNNEDPPPADSYVPVPQPPMTVLQEWNQRYAPLERTRPMCLHAAKLSFAHPTRCPVEMLNFEVEPSFDEYLNDL